MAQKESRPERAIKIRFTNVESPGNDLYFAHGGKQYHLVDGQSYDLPASLVDHLNGLAYPVYGDELDRATGQIKSKPMGRQHRFSLLPAEGFARMGFEAA